MNKIYTILNSIEELLYKIEDIDGCSYGDYNCGRCNHSGDTDCTHYIKIQIIQKLQEIKDETERNR